MWWWPGWDSIEWTDFWNNFYFWAGIFCLFLLGASEVVSHYYGERRNDLVAAAASRKVEKQKQEDIRRDHEVAEARNTAKTANDELTKLREQQAPRHLTDAQKIEAIRAIFPFKGQAVKITANIGDIESDDFAREFYEVVKEAGWNYKGEPRKFGTRFSDHPIGVEVSLNQSDVEGRRVPKETAAAYNALMEALHKLGIVNRDEPAFVNPDVPSGMIEIRVGSKPSKPGQTSADRHPETIKRFP